MKKKTILYLVSLFFLSVPLTGRGQDRKAWEIGAGGSLINSGAACLSPVSRVLRIIICTT